MTSLYLFTFLLALGGLAVMLLVRSARREARAAIERDMSRDQARKADKNAKIAAQRRTADDVAGRLRGKDDF